jgi:hypothetical protein
MEIISQSILFRHGARGPGDSELACWESNHSVVTQWKDEEIENLSNIGLLQMSRLGSWFASRFSSDSSSMLCRFFSSKSSRAALSGQIFINSFKASFINKVCLFGYCKNISYYSLCVLAAKCLDQSIC